MQKKKKILTKQTTADKMQANQENATTDPSSFCVGTQNDTILSCRDRQKCGGEMEGLGRVSASDLVVGHIREKIRRGELQVGDRLPAEAELARELNVGRSSLREGIKILAAYGVVEVRQGEGTFIVDRVAETFFDVMGFFSSKENYEMLLKLRRVLEVGNLLDIYDTVSPDELETLARYTEMFAEKHTVKEYVEADYAFHSMLISISHNPMLDQMNKMLSNMRRDLLYRIFTREEVIREAYEEHGKILAGIRRKDLHGAMEAMYEHIATTLSEVKEMAADEVLF